VTGDHPWQPGAGRHDPHRRLVAGMILLVVLAGTTMLTAGCTATGDDPVIGTWEWTDGKGYVERYTFHPDHTFSAEALGSAFIGTWEPVGDGRYQVTYRYRDDPGAGGTLTELVVFDRATDAIYFPAHRRVA
jgi:hypothetical protein